MRRIVILSIVAALLCFHQAFGQVTAERAGLGFPGFDPVSISLGGLRSIGFGDPVHLVTNPSAISPRLGACLYSVSYGPVVSDISFTDAAGTHGSKWTSALGSSSLGMDFDLNSAFTVGIAFARTGGLPFSQLYYSPGHGAAAGDTMQAEGSFGEADVGFAWEAFRRLVLGASLGMRISSQEYAVSYADPTGTITGYKYSRIEPVFNLGLSVPLERLTLGLCWKSPGEFEKSILAAGGMYRIFPNFSAGGEIELRNMDSGTVFTERAFAIVIPSDALALRAGVFHAGGAGEISREGVGFSGGIGYSIGTIDINAGVSRSRIRGDRDVYGYEDLDSYDGNNLILSLGIAYSGRNR